MSDLLRHLMTATGYAFWAACLVFLVLGYLATLREWRAQRAEERARREAAADAFHLSHLRSPR